MPRIEAKVISDVEKQTSNGVVLTVEGVEIVTDSFLSVMTWSNCGRMEIEFSGDDQENQRQLLELNGKPTRGVRVSMTEEEWEAYQNDPLQEGNKKLRDHTYMPVQEIECKGGIIYVSVHPESEGTLFIGDRLPEELDSETL